jgi:peptidoglycan/LPS O-acetylase OafA/YrhL
MSEAKKLPGLDHLRALAILLVLLYHYCRLFPHPRWTETWGSFGWIGVDLFFVLSGYLIASQLFREIQIKNTIQLKTFYLKRFFRIIPAYLTVLLIYFSIPAFKETEGLPPLWKFLSFTQNIQLDLRSQRAFSHAWSLCIEEQFYLLFPIILFFLTFIKQRKIAFWGLLILFFTTLLLRFISWNYLVAPLAGTEGFGFNWAKWIYYPTYNRLDSLLVGVFLAGISVFLPRAKEFIDRYHLLFLGMGLFLITISYFMCEQQTTFTASVFGFSLVALSFGFITAAAISPACFLHQKESRITSAIALLSYSMYLLHKGIIHLTHRYCMENALDPESTLVFWISMSITFAASLVLYFTIERSFINFRKVILTKSGKSPEPQENKTGDHFS